MAPGAGAPLIFLSLHCAELYILNSGLESSPPPLIKPCSHTTAQCHILIGSFLSEDGKIAVASSVSTFVITSVVFFTFGYLCRHYRQKPKQTLPVPVTNRTPLYENVIPEQNTEQDLELKENVAYGPIAIIS